MTRKILISGGLSGGGVATHVNLLCKLLLQDSNQITICATHSEWDPNEVDELRQLGVRVLLPRLGAAESLLTWPLRLRRDFDVFYCVGHGRIHDLTRTFLSKAGTSVYHEILTAPTFGVMTQLIPKLDFVVANSKAIKLELQRHWPNKVIRVIPFLTADRRVNPPLHRPAAGGRELRIVYLGRLASHKRPQKLIESWEALGSRPPIGPARLDVYGDDRDPATLLRLRTFVLERGLESRIAIHGSYPHSSIPNILSTADMVVLPSEWEGLPLVLVEAMQHGVPIVATAVGGTAELGENNPDVIVTGAAWEEFVSGLERMAEKVRIGSINAQRLHQWTEQRYGFEAVGPLWIRALMNSSSFFSQSRTA